MADGAFSSIRGLPSANIFWFHRLISLAADIGFKCQLDLEWPLLGIVRDEKCKLSPPLLVKKHFYWTDLFETSIHATT